MSLRAARGSDKTQRQSRFNLLASSGESSDEEQQTIPSSNTASNTASSTAPSTKVSEAATSSTSKKSKSKKKSTSKTRSSKQEEQQSTPSNISAQDRSSSSSSVDSSKRLNGSASQLNGTPKDSILNAGKATDENVKEQTSILPEHSEAISLPTLVPATPERKIEPPKKLASSSLAEPSISATNVAYSSTTSVTTDTETNDEDTGVDDVQTVRDHPVDKSSIPHYSKYTTASTNVADNSTTSSASIVREKSPTPIIPVRRSSNAAITVKPPPASNPMVRTIWTLIMVIGFLGLVLLGHVYLIILVFTCQAIVFRELSSLFSTNHSSNGEAQPVSPARQSRRRQRDRSARALSWYFFAITNYFLYGETIAYYFKHIVLIDSFVLPFAQHHRMISFMLYIIGFVGFVGSLKRNQLRRQFALFCWIHMSLLLIVLSSHFMVNNILEGLIWFLVPASLVIVNDITAYIFGMLFGRTPLTELSPKKTVEGFVGAFFSTIVFAYAWSTFSMRYDYMICPVQDLGKTAFSEIDCRPNPVFEWRELALPGFVVNFLSQVLRRNITHFPWAPFQLHGIVMAVFASLVAPFGGFFASGFKRAFNIKDFGDSIPGHGGMTDRMDCQFLMGLFSYVYYSSLIRFNHVTVGSVLQTVITALDPAEQLELFTDLHKYLSNQGIIKQ